MASSSGGGAYGASGAQQPVARSDAGRPPPNGAEDTATTGEHRLQLRKAWNLREDLPPIRTAAVGEESGGRRRGNGELDVN